MVKIGLRTPSLRKRIAARTSLTRVVRHSLGLKAPRGWGGLTNPKRVAYNRTTVDCVVILLSAAVVLMIALTLT